MSQKLTSGTVIIKEKKKQSHTLFENLLQISWEYVQLNDQQQVHLEGFSGTPPEEDQTHNEKRSEVNMRDVCSRIWAGFVDCRLV